jgi:hypothetical protein
MLARVCVIEIEVKIVILNSFAEVSAFCSKLYSNKKLFI